MGEPSCIQTPSVRMTMIDLAAVVGIPQMHRRQAAPVLRVSGD